MQIPDRISKMFDLYLKPMQVEVLALYEAEQVAKTLNKTTAQRLVNVRITQPQMSWNLQRFSLSLNYPGLLCVVASQRLASRVVSFTESTDSTAPFFFFVSAFPKEGSCLARKVVCPNSKVHKK